MKIHDVSCDICQDKIGLYQPWYSILVKGKLAIIPQNPAKAGLKHNPMTLCPNCFQAYKDFLLEREVQENHKRNYNDIVNHFSK